MKYQLVLQFPEFSENSDRNLDWLFNLENKLRTQQLIDADIDGHDIGSGEMNIFIFTNYPREVFKKIKVVLKNCDALDEMKSAYRDVDSDHYICLWPADLTDFQVI